jgi:hypothetical protein
MRKRDKIISKRIKTRLEMRSLLGIRDNERDEEGIERIIRENPSKLKMFLREQHGNKEQTAAIKKLLVSVIHRVDDDTPDVRDE